MRITGPENWKDSYGIEGSDEFNALETKLTSAVSCNFKIHVENSLKSRHNVTPHHASRAYAQEEMLPNTAVLGIVTSTAVYAHITLLHTY